MEKKENIPIIVLIIILILVSLSSCGYIIYDKFFSSSKDKEITDNKEENKNNETSSTDLYTKTFDVEYNNVNHKISIEYTNTKKDEANKLYYNDYNIYVDNELIGTERAYEGYWTTESEPEEEIRYEGYKEDMEKIQVHAMDKKYLVIILPKTSFKTSYTAHFYNNNKEVKELEIITSGTGFTDINGNDLNTIEKVDFDGTSLKYYDKCTYDLNNKKISYVALNFDGEKLTKKVIKEVNNITISGGEMDTESCNLE